MEHQPRAGHVNRPMGRLALDAVGRAAVLSEIAIVAPIISRVTERRTATDQQPIGLDEAINLLVIEHDYSEEEAAASIDAAITEGQLELTEDAELTLPEQVA